jgi:hypothetical protein
MLRRKSISYPQSGWEGPPSRACMQVQAQACKDLIKSTLMRDWIRP